MNTWELTIHQLDELLDQGEVSSLELVQSKLEHIDEVDGQIQAYLTLTAEEALEAAAASDLRRRRGEKRGRLDGIPYALKDNICTANIRTTCASKILEEYVPPYDATVVERLRSAGSVLVGKVNMDEFAMGSSCENSAFFPTRNPWDLNAVPGGSSGGSAAAVAAGEATFALGSDTGGSVRQPASFCGVVGLKPTYGLLSRYGLVAFASSLDQIGPVTRDVRDAAYVMDQISGVDPKDATSVNVGIQEYAASLDGEVRGLRVGLPDEYFESGIDPVVHQSVMAAVELLSGLGVTFERCSLPHTEYAIPAYYLIAPAEASSNLTRFDGVRYGLRVEDDDFEGLYRQTRQQGFGPEVKRRIMLGTHALSSGYYDDYYLKAQRVRTLLRQDFDRAFEQFDLLISPTAPSVAFDLGARQDPLEMYLSDTCTVPINLTGIPAISIPCGFDRGRPIGLQIMGRHFDERRLLKLAHAFEQATDYHRHRPQLELAGQGARVGDGR